MPRSRLLFLIYFVLPTLAAGLCPWPAVAQSEEESHHHEEALQVPTGDPVLQEQIVQVTNALEGIHQQMAQRRQAIQKETDEARKAALYAELDGLRKEHDMLERLLHELVDEAKATEWTKIDEALRKTRPQEQRQEERYRQEESIRDRQS